MRAALRISEVGCVVYFVSLQTITKNGQDPKKLANYAWWSGLGSQAIQDIVIRIDKGYQAFFRNLQDRQAKKTSRKVRPPTFRKVRNAQSFTLT